MNIHEYQAKELMGKFGVAVPKGKVAFSADEAYDAAKQLGSPRFVVKAQVHAGGRGKAGGIKLVTTPEDVKSMASQMIGMKLVTHQTGPEGKLVKKVYIEEASDVQKEMYLGVVIDRTTKKIVVMASTEGGVEIEEVAAKSPERIVKEFIDPVSGIQDFYGRKAAYRLGLQGDLVGKFTRFVKSLYKMFVELDCSLAEINPLVITKSGDILALDAKINFDDNALFRHKEIEALRDIDEEDPAELDAKQHGLSYISLTGNIGCMVNGAGLAMSTMDIIKLYGGEPANFLDVGGSASKEQVTHAFKIILSDERVKGILVNIFGGIMKCDVIAGGIIAAAKEININVPLVVRLEGTNVELGKKMLDESGLNIITASDMTDAANKVVNAVKGEL
ncbi:MAG: ADP-forming succinate--CoA ligase subunit beta [Deltaproteobacteria bacterium]|nr:ADP-forming succinate--CoA ligase subunit beta [Deltaproteobacteria bacterium]